ncbi:MAG: LemA family protein [Bacilli bacterium]|nr:LemA family protein [Bacilli bacterium]
MPNELDETDVSLINHEGRDVHVIEKKVTVSLDGADKFVNVAVWFLFIIGGLVYMGKKAKAYSYFQQLQQKIQHAASTIDNYLLQRVNILQNTAKLVEKAVDLDKSTFTEIARLRSGSVASDEARVELAEKLNAAEKSINVAFENYPQLKAHQEIADAMQQNSYLQHEITAAREIYNDCVFRWNSEIFQRWAKKFVAAKNGYATRIPFSVSDQIKAQANGVFF